MKNTNTITNNTDMELSAEQLGAVSGGGVEAELAAKYVGNTIKSGIEKTANSVLTTMKQVFNVPGLFYLVYKVDTAKSYNPSTRPFS